MILKNNMMLTLANGLNYIILENIPYGGIKYMHLVKLNQDGSEVLDEFMVAKEIKENDKTFIEAVLDDEELELVLPMLKMSYYRRNKELGNITAIS